MAQPNIGDSVIFVDSKAQEHKALVTNQFGTPGGEEMSINCLYVSTDESMTDQYGRQIVREYSVPPGRYQSAHGNFWKSIE